jgi:hypothetical protein
VKNSHIILVQKPERKRPLERTRRRGDDSTIEMYLKEIRCEDVDWIHLAQDRVQFAVLDLPIP